MHVSPIRPVLENMRVTDTTCPCSGFKFSQLEMSESIGELMLAFITHASSLVT